MIYAGEGQGWGRVGVSDEPHLNSLTEKQLWMQLSFQDRQSCLQANSTKPKRKKKQACDSHAVVLSTPVSWSPLQTPETMTPGQ